MKTSRLPIGKALLCGCLLVASLTVRGAEATSDTAAAATNAPAATAEAEPADQKADAAPAELTPEQLFEGGAKAYPNWIEFGVGGFFTSGNKAQFQQNSQTSADLFGGIQDFHYQRDLAKGTTMVLDGRALFEQNDFGLNLKVAKEKLGYVRVNFDQFRSWYNPDGGFYAPLQLSYGYPGDAAELDRSNFSVEAGLTLDKLPQIVLRYTHRTREGDKNSTRWGLTHPGFGDQTRGLSPTILAVDEQVDTFELDATYQYKATGFGAGLRYETASLDNTAKITHSPGEPIERRITDHQGTSYDLFNVHAFTETWLKQNVMLSTGFSYSDVDNDLSGSRIYGSLFNVNYEPNTLNGVGYNGLNGGSRMNDYSFNVNLMARPNPHLSIVPSLRVQREDIDSSVSGIESSGANPTLPFSAESDRGVLDVRERLDVTYTGITNIVLYARGELGQGDGNLQETGGLVPVNGIGIPAVQRETDDQRNSQKYSGGIRYYPLKSVSLDLGGYYKLNSYEYDHLVDSTPNDGVNRYPAYLRMQDIQTYDGNFRLTWKPLRNLSFVARYEFQQSDITTQPDPISGLGSLESSDMTTHLTALDANWSPWSRLYLQAGVNYVESETATPASKVTQAILDAENNYWTLNFNATVVLDQKTDLKAGYVFYQADNFEDNSLEGLPLGMSATRHGVTAMISRRLSENVRLNLRYGYFNYDDGTYGGTRDYDSHLIYSSLQYRF